jgi:hypothetical protein
VKIDDKFALLFAYSSQLRENFSWCFGSDMLTCLSLEGLVGWLVVVVWQ